MPALHHFGLDKVLFPKISSMRMQYLSWSKSNAAARIKLAADGGVVDGDERKDFFSYLLKAKDPETGEGFTMEELWGENNLMIIAGSCSSYGCFAMIRVVRN
jgi:hypothetical protein